MASIRAQVHTPAAYADRVTDLVTLAGLRPTPRAQVALLVTHDDDASITDRWLVDSLPHLVVRLYPQAVRIGPFVHPGVTACLRCVRAEEGTRPAGVDTGIDLGIGGPHGAVDQALLMAGLSLAVRDLATWLSGDLPVTWSSSLTLTPRLTSEARRWLRHPHCGCSWGPIDHSTDSWTRPADVRHAG